MPGSCNFHISKPTRNLILYLPLLKQHSSFHHAGIIVSSHSIAAASSCNRPADCILHSFTTFNIINKMHSSCWTDAVSNDRCTTNTNTETRKVASHGLTLSALPLCCGWHQWTYVCRYSERGTSRHPCAIINKKRQSSWSNNYLKYFRAVFKSMPELTE